LGWQPPEETIQLSGRTDGDLIVMFDAPADSAEGLIGQIIDVEVTGSAPLALFGRRVGSGVAV
ncbi:MAG: hypothetical protein AAF593_11330, partial [Planctomycetota bacterium]